MLPLVGALVRFIEPDQSTPYCFGILPFSYTEGLFILWFVSELSLIWLLLHLQYAISNIEPYLFFYLVLEDFNVNSSWCRTTFHKCSFYPGKWPYASVPRVRPQLEDKRVEEASPMITKLLLSPLSDRNWKTSSQ